MKILITGKNGQVGFELQKSLAPLGQVIAVDIEDCDLCDSSAIADLVQSTQPDLIVNPAAYTAVDMAQTDIVLAQAINVAAPKVFAQQAQLLQIPLIHYWTDYVFDGSKNGWYTEVDLSNPQSVYGKTKWEDEENVRAICPNHVILRTSWVFGAHGANFLKTILRLAPRKSSFRDDCRPIWCAHFGKVIGPNYGRNRSRIIDWSNGEVCHLPFGGRRGNNLVWIRSASAGVGQ